MDNENMLKLIADELSIDSVDRYNKEIMFDKIIAEIQELIEISWQYEELG